MSDSTTFFGAFPPVSTEEWEAQIKKDLNGADYRETLRWETGEGIQPLPFYRRDNLEQLRPLYPLTKTVHHPWEVRERITGSSIADANGAAQQARDRGADALQISLRIHSADRTKLQIQGLPLQNQSDFSSLMKDIPLDQTPLHIDAGRFSPVILAMLWEEVQRQSLDQNTIKGTLCYDPFANLLQSGHLPAPGELPGSIAQIASFFRKNLPAIRPVGVDARLYHNSGGTIVQELSFALASAAEMLVNLTKQDFTVDEAAGMLHFNCGVGSKYFLEIAKFRALRLLWQNMLDAFGGDSERYPAYIHAETSRWNKTVYDPYTNMLRTSTEGMSAVIGGCDALTVLPFDEHFQQPDDFSRRVARNSQIVMREEAYLNKVQDPAAGSYYVEQLTHTLAQKAWQLFQEVEERGGMSKAIEEGFVQSTIEQSQQQQSQDIARRKHIFVGTNQYPNPKEPRTEAGKHAQTSVALRTTGRDFKIKAPYSIKELSNFLAEGATLGNLASLFMNTSETAIQLLEPYRGARAFEELRLATEKHETTPTVLNLPVGDPKTRKARSAFSNNFFGCVGYDIEDPIGFEDVATALEVVRQEQPDIVVLCSSDQEYKELVPVLCKKMDQIEETPLLVLAGYPKEQIESYRKAGIDLFIYSGCNTLETLKDVQQKLGIIKNDQ